MTDEANLRQQVFEAAEELTEQGSVGFYASAIVTRTGGDPFEVTQQLLKLVDEQLLEPSFEIRCPDNGRRVRSYEKISDIPFGKEIHSDRCESPEPFVLDETDVFIRFRLTRRSSSALRRRRYQEEGGGDLGKAQRTCVRRGSSPRISLRQ
jgi:hypothetical protein